MQAENIFYEQKLLTIIRTLPPAMVEQILDFAAFLQTKQTVSKVVTQFPLANTVLKYDDPTEPIAENDWDALQ